MGARLWLLLGSTLLALTEAQAATVQLAWDWPQRLGTSTWSLTMTADTGAGTTARTVLLTAMAPEACHSLVGAAYQPDATWCATLPQQAPGVYRAVLRAGSSPPSNEIRFAIAPDGSAMDPEAWPLVAQTTEASPSGPPAEPALPPDLPPLPDTLTPSEPPTPPPVENTTPLPAVLPADPPTELPPRVPPRTAPPTPPTPPRTTPRTEPPAQVSRPPVQPVTGLDGQLAALTVQYETAQQQIVEAYLRTLATGTPEAAQQAYVAGSAQLDQLYQATLQAWQQLYDTWQQTQQTTLATQPSHAP
jgi:hypothetical protein